MPLLYPEKSLTWEAQICNAFDEAGTLTLVHGLPIWPMIGKLFMALLQEAGFRMMEKKDLPHVHNFESVPNFDKERGYKYFKVNAEDTPKEPNEDASMIITQIQLYHYAIGVSEETLCQSSYTPFKALFLLGIGPITYNLFHLLHPILLDATEEKENYWMKLNKETLAYFSKEFKNNSKHKLQCIGA
jgi:hypothetical protein